MSQLDQVMQLGTMSQHDLEEYSKFAHGHDYTDFYFFPSYGPQSNNSEYKDASKCQVYGRFDITKYLPGEDAKHTYSISACGPEFVEHINNGVYQSRRVGDIQLLAIDCTFEKYLTDCRKYQLIESNGRKNVDINHASFDGYVIPNGMTYTCAADQFKDACRAYSSSHSENATSFTVPDLAGFFKGNPATQTSNAMQRIPFQNGLAEHNHLNGGKQIQNDYTGDDVLRFSIDPFYQWTSATGWELCPGFVHGGTGRAASPTQFTLKRLSFDANISVIDVALAGNDEESYPTYNDVPVMVYIGDK